MLFTYLLIRRPSSAISKVASCRVASNGITHVYKYQEEQQKVYLVISVLPLRP